MPGQRPEAREDRNWRIPPGGSSDSRGTFHSRPSFTGTTQDRAQLTRSGSAQALREPIGRPTSGKAGSATEPVEARRAVVGNPGSHLDALISEATGGHGVRPAMSRADLMFSTATGRSAHGIGGGGGRRKTMKPRISMPSDAEFARGRAAAENAAAGGGNEKRPQVPRHFTGPGTIMTA